MTKKVNYAHSITRDHRIPKSDGGGNERRNLVGACRRCNTLKLSMSERDFNDAYPTPHAIETALPLEEFHTRVRRRLGPTQLRPRQFPQGRHRVLSAADREAAWRELADRFPPLPPRQPVGFCSGCQFFAPLAPGYAAVCQKRWQRGDWHVATPLTSAADSCHEHASRPRPPPS